MATILLVDDSPTVIRVMSVSLMANGFQVLSANSGSQGLQAARDRKPDAIVLDIHLPDIDGLDLLARIKEDPQLAAIPVLLLTGQDDFTHAEKAMTIGAAGFMAKYSTTPKVLLEKLRSLLGPAGSR